MPYSSRLRHGLRCRRPRVARCHHFDGSRNPCYESRFVVRRSSQAQGTVARRLKCVCSAASAPPRSDASASVDATSTSSRTSQFRHYFESQGFFQATVLRNGEQCNVRLSLHGIRTRCHVQWGLFRSSPEQWVVPEKLVPHGSEHCDGIACTAFERTEGGTAQYATITLPSTALPAFLGCRIVSLRGKHDTPSSTMLRPRLGSRISVPLGMDCGSPDPAGAQLTRASDFPERPGIPFSVNFAVTSRHASSVKLRLLRHADGKVRKVFDLALDPVLQRSGDTWHVEVHGLKDAPRLAYAWLVDGDVGWRGRARFAPSSPLLDPYATEVASLQLPETEQGGRTILAGLLHRTRASMTWSSMTRLPQVPQDEAVLMEVDPVTFAAPELVRNGHGGKWLGILDRVPYLRGLGVTSVVLRCPMLRRRGLGVQGEATVSFFVPDGRFAVDQGRDGPAREFIRLVSGLHAAGIEVLIQCEFCFTAEGTDTDPTLIGLRGLDAAIYYRPNGVLNLAHPVVQRLVMASLRHWATQFQVDGFVLLSAEAMMQDREGLVQDCPPIMEAIARDPALSELKVMAWPRDTALLPRQGLRGVPHSAALLQHNGEFRDLLAWLGGDGTGAAPSPRGATLLSRVATRLTGSADVFQADWSLEASLPGNLAAGRRPAFSINSISSPIVDGVGISGWLDAVCPHDTEAAKYRNVLWKTTLMLLILASGTPLLAAADLEYREFARFAAAAVAARSEGEHLLRAQRFESWRDLSWFDAHGQPPRWDWGDCDGMLGLVSKEGGAVGAAAVIIVNASWQEKQATLPNPPAGSLWRIVLNTGAPPPDDALGSFATAVQLRAGSPLYIQAKAAVLLVGGRY